MTSTSSFKTTVTGRPQKRLLESRNEYDATAHNIFMGCAIMHVVSYGGTGQCSGDGMGASTFGLATLNFARVAFSIEERRFAGQLFCRPY